MTLTQYWILLIQEGAQLSEALPEDSPLWISVNEILPYWYQNYIWETGSI